MSNMKHEWYMIRKRGYIDFFDARSVRLIDIAVAQSMVLETLSDSDGETGEPYGKWKLGGKDSLKYYDSQWLSKGGVTYHITCYDHEVKVANQTFKQDFFVAAPSRGDFPSTGFFVVLVGFRVGKHPTKKPPEYLINRNKYLYGTWYRIPRTSIGKKWTLQNKRNANLPDLIRSVAAGRHYAFDGDQILDLFSAGSGIENLTQDGGTGTWGTGNQGT